MNGKDRILNTFKQKQTDRIPYFEQAVASTVVSELLGRKALGFTTDLHYIEAQALFAGDAAYNDFLEQFKIDYEELVYKLDLDMVSCPWFLWEKPTEKIDEFTFRYQNEFGWTIRKFNPDSQTFGEMETNFDLEGEEGVAAFVKKLVQTDPAKCFSERYYQYLDWLIQTFGEDRCIAGGSAIAVPMHPAWWMTLLTDPGIVCEYLDFIAETEKHLAARQAVLGIKVINGGGDLANNKGPLYSPAIFTEVMLPRLKKVISEYRKYGMHYIFRSDGNTWSIADKIFNEAGADGYGEIEVESGMTFPELKKAFPNLTLWGGLPCGSLLFSKSDDEIVNYAKNLCESLQPVRGWIAGSSNSLLHGTNLRGYLKAIQAIKEFRI